MCAWEFEQEQAEHMSQSHSLTDTLLILLHFVLFTRFEGGGDALWNHAEEVPRLQRDPPACQPSNVSQLPGRAGAGEQETLGGVCGWDGGGLQTTEDAITNLTPNETDSS